MAATEHVGFATAKQVTEKTEVPEIHEPFPEADDNTYFRDYLRFAVRRCLESAELYDNAVTMVIGSDLRSFFGAMAKLKRYEAERLYRSQDNSHSFIAAENAPPQGGAMISHLIIDTEVKFIETMVDASHFALKNERNDLQIYKRLADLEEDPAAKNLFLLLVQLQKSHLRFVYNQLSLTGLELEGAPLFSSGKERREQEIRA